MIKMVINIEETEDGVVLEGYQEVSNGTVAEIVIGFSIETLMHLIRDNGEDDPTFQQIMDRGIEKAAKMINMIETLHEDRDVQGQLLKWKNQHTSFTGKN